MNKLVSINLGGPGTGRFTLPDTEGLGCLGIVCLGRMLRG